jgi:hypothetical protein
MLKTPIIAMNLLSRGPVTYVPRLLVTQKNLVLFNSLTSTLISQSGQHVRYGSGGQSTEVFHSLPDGAGVFETPVGGWIYVSNSDDYSSS